MSFSASGIHPDLFQILRGYAALIPPNHLSFPSHLQAEVIHDFLVDRVLTNPHFKTYPPSKEYQKSFWKWIILHLERKLGDSVGSSPIQTRIRLTRLQSDLEVDPRIYEHYLELLRVLFAPPVHLVILSSLLSPPSQSYVTHIWRPDKNSLATYQTTTLLESRTTIEGGTTGLRTWLASLVLAQYLIRNPALVHGKRILELGSGIGFLGSVVASLQLLQRPTDGSTPGKIWMTDINDSVLSRCRDNIQLPCNLSSSHPDVECCFLDWSTALDPDGVVPLTSLLEEELDADLILGADIASPMIPYLIPALVALLRLALPPRSRPRFALIALTVRIPTTRDKFTDAIRSAGNSDDLTLENIDPPMEERMFMEPMQGGADANNGVTIFRISARQGQ
ncbi:hypothetical protein B0H11DRAFT_1848194 [Mycena galericulata]|nr:hypothetical protein B0H11DRAFT_1848194 [Mycena galericulata]